MALLRYVFKFLKTLNDCLAVQEVAGITFGKTTTFPNVAES